MTFYENDDFQGRSYSTRGAVSNFLDRGFNDRASFIVVTSQRWEVCEGAAQQRCWMEKQDVVVEGKSRSNVPGAVLGAVLGGVIGHQIGGGTGRDIATVGGAVAGGALGSRVGADGRSVESRDVQRCSTAPNDRGAEYWDVTYSFRGQQHHAQLKQPPGPTITVNGQGEPRE